MKNWVTFQLSERGESALDEDPKTIQNVIRKYISSEIFFPMHYNKSRSFENRIYLFKGYVFVEYNPKEAVAYNKITNSSYFLGPLLANKRLYLTGNEEIKKLKRQLQKLSEPQIKVGDKVKVLDGKYTNLEAIETEYYSKEKEVDLSVELKCMNILVPRIPVVCLKNVSAEEKSQGTLLDKIIAILKDHVNGITRKEILDLIDLSDLEVKRVSTCLSRAVKRGLVKTRENEDALTVFFLNAKKS